MLRIWFESDKYFIENIVFRKPSFILFNFFTKGFKYNKSIYYLPILNYRNKNNPDEREYIMNASVL